MILSFKSKKEEVICLSEIDKVYIKIDKMTPIYLFLLLFSSLFIILLSLIYLTFDMILLVPILIIVTAAVKLNKRKIYGLKIRLKDGRLFRQEVPHKLKYKTIDNVNLIRQEIYNYKINN